MTGTTFGRLGVAAASVTGLLAALAFSVPASSAEADLFRFFEERAEANWLVAHECADGSVIEARLLVLGTLDFQTPDTEDTQLTARVQYSGTCPLPEGSFNLRNDVIPAEVTFAPNLASAHVQGSGQLRDDLGNLHPVDFDVSWTGVGMVEREVRVFSSPGFATLVHTEEHRDAVAAGVVNIDDLTVSGEANNPFRPTFIETEEDRRIAPPSGSDF
jgi:hypothetical protein